MHSPARAHVAPSRALLLLVFEVALIAVLQVASAENTGECGVPRTRPSLVIGGETAIPHEFPWQVSLQIQPSIFQDWAHFCGGALIDSEWIVTAAHCVGLPGPVRAALGKHDLGLYEEGQVVQRIVRAIRHPWYDEDALEYDVALMKLQRPVNFTQNLHIAPICLPSRDDFAVFDDQLCTASGWGQMTLRRPETAQVLQKIPVLTVPYADCRNQYSRARISLSKSMLCGAPTVQGEVCHGDSGGPLQCLREGRYVLAGDVSHGGCGQSPVPTMYGRLSEVIDWIDLVRNNQ